jgi:hypothetical protein
VKYDPEYFETTVLGILLPYTLSPELSLRHGAAIATAEVIRALHDCGHQLTPGEGFGQCRTKKSLSFICQSSLFCDFELIFSHTSGSYDDNQSQHLNT